MNTKLYNNNIDVHIIVQALMNILHYNNIDEHVTLPYINTNEHVIIITLMNTLQQCH